MGQRQQYEHGDEDAGATTLLGGVPEAFEQADGPLVALGEQEPSEGEMFVFAQVGRLVVGVEPLLDRPRGGEVQLAAAEVQPGPHRRHRLDVREVVAVVDPLGLDQQGERGVEIALDLAEPGQHHPRPVRVLRQALVLAEALRGREVLGGAREVVAFEQHPGQSDVHVGRAAQPSGAEVEARFERAPGRAEPPLHEAEVAEGDRAAEDVGEEPGVPQPRDGLRVRGVRARDVARRPRREPSQGPGACAHQVVARRGQGQRRPRLRHGGADVAVVQRQRRPVHPDGRGERAVALLVHH